MNELNNINLPLLITKGSVIFPKQIVTLYAERDFSIKAINESVNFNDSLIFVTSEKNITKETIDGEEDIYNVGTLCKIVTDVRQNNLRKITVESLDRYKFSNLHLNEGSFYCTGELLKETFGDQNEEIALVRILIENLEKDNLEYFFGKQNPNFYNQIKNGQDSLSLTYLFSQSLLIETEKKQKLLETNEVNERIKLLISYFEILKIRINVDREVQNSIRKSSEKQQKEYYLREQLRAIKQQLGENGDEGENRYLEKVKKGNYPQEVVDKVNEEISRLDNLPQGSLEYSLVLDYLDLLLSLPFNVESVDNDDLKNAKKILDDDHYGLEKVKDRIIEYLAIKKVNGNLKAPVLCFYGPPGTGKTSLSISIAKALGRKFIKCSLGGISDEAEIRGHRRTYVGSKPGRIMTFLKKAGANNPVFCLDEIDKLGGQSMHGDPSSALLEVLDPEQNTHFRDNYLEVEYDLSKVLFICTCNYLENVPEPLRDRLELIPIDSYTLIEKVKIAQEHLIKKEAKLAGIDSNNITFSKAAIEHIIERYTREAGVRELSRKIGTIIRKVIVEQLNNNSLNSKATIGVKDVRKYLGIELFDPTDKAKEAQIGIVTGLAYTQFGGDILPIEVNYFEGKGVLVLTGNLGDIMKESCSIALDYVKANAKRYDIDPNFFSKYDIHIHVPEGAVPKDGPSAGVAITTAIISAITKKPVSNNIAMTGEVNLVGNALPIGGLREKSLAALRSGIKTIIVPQGNKKNISELPKEITNNLNIVYMNNVDDALKVCF